MIRFLVVRAGSGLAVLFLVATVTFVLLRLVPGGPFDAEKALPPEIKRHIEARYHLDEPWPLQYARYVASLGRGDFGPSYKFLDRSVNDILADTFPISIQLGALALLLAVTLGVAVGIGAAWWHDTPIDRAGLAAATLGISLPSFVLGATLIGVFAVGLGLFPAARWEGMRHAVLPALTLGLPPAAYLARLTRASILDALREDYVRTARAKGLAERRVLVVHVVANSLIPVLTVLGPLTAALVTGSFVVEYLFAIPGMGRFFVTAVTNRDYPLMMAVTLVYGAILIVMNTLVDILYTVVDPRIRVS